MRSTVVAVGSAVNRRRIYVDPLRLVSDAGPERPEFNASLVQLLRLRRYEVLSEPETTAYRLRVVLLESRLTPRGLANPASSYQRIKGVLIAPDETEHNLGSFSSTTEFSREEFPVNDVTPHGRDRALKETFLPLVNAVDDVLR
jgi:hypothetical protein